MLFVPWSKHLCATTDFNRVIQMDAQIYDAETAEQEYNGDQHIRPVCWIAQIKSYVPTQSDILLFLSPYECGELINQFRSSQNAVLHMYMPRLIHEQSNLLNERHLQFTGMQNVDQIDKNDEIQIGIFAGSMYFDTTEEQDAFCNFMGLVPRIRSWKHEELVVEKKIELNGYVPKEHRQEADLRDFVDKCKFTENPTQSVIGIIVARHQFLRKESHLASILEKGEKVKIDKNLKRIPDDDEFIVDLTNDAD